MIGYGRVGQGDLATTGQREVVGCDTGIKHHIARSLHQHLARGCTQIGINNAIAGVSRSNVDIGVDVDLLAIHRHGASYGDGATQGDIGITSAIGA